MNLKRFFNCLVMFYSITVNAQNESSPSHCNQDCNTAFGTFVGQSFKTPAYSNCSGDCVKNENYYLQLPELKKPIFTGMKWQCVEYARRWLVMNRGITFDDVTYAYHIWDFKNGHQVITEKAVPMLRFKNAKATTPPEVGDLLLYSNALAITGHVAVIVGIEKDSVTIAEQNYFNRLWEGENYARRLLLIKDDKGFYRISDEAVIGWVRFNTK